MAMMRQIEVMQAGSPVTLADNIPARITGILINDKCRVTYQCVWWDDSTRMSEWLEEFEVTRADETQDMTIGLQIPPKPDPPQIEIIRDDQTRVSKHAHV